MNEFDQKYRARFEKLSTTNVADAEDALSICHWVLAVQ